MVSRLAEDFEDRRPARFEVDEECYLTRYPDVVDEIEAGKIVSATEHFRSDGCAGGRLPSEY